jgi:hypothetical protein
MHMVDTANGVGITLYRLWIHTEVDKDDKGSYGDVSICLHGALGSVWLEQLHACQPSAGRLFPSASAASSACERCEIYVSAKEVGTLYRITVAYAHGDSGFNCRPWRLSQVAVRNGSDGMVSVFPGPQQALEGPKALLELVPRLSWHEDLYGNCAEAPPPVPETGQWHWPASPPAPPLTAAGGDEAKQRSVQRSEHDALQLAIYNAVCEEEILPLMDAVLHDLSMRRTPGTFLHRCMQAATGTLPRAVPSTASSTGKPPLPKPRLKTAVPSAPGPITNPTTGATADTGAGVTIGAFAVPRVSFQDDVDEPGERRSSSSSRRSSSSGSSKDTERELQEAYARIRRLEEEKSELMATSRSSTRSRSNRRDGKGNASASSACVLS